MSTTVRARWLVLFLAVGARAGDPAAPTDRDSFSFVVFGDRTGGRGSGVRVLEQAVRATNELDPEFTMTVGDLVQGYADQTSWLRQAREYKTVMNRLHRPWYPVAGNHDVYGRGKWRKAGHAGLYQKHFAPLWYSFDYKWAHFVVLYTDEKLAFRNPRKTQNMSPAQLEWLEQDLAQTRAKQVFVFLHHPRWTYQGTNWPKVHAVLKKSGRVKAVFGGHIHVYRDDGVRDGIHYYTLAVTGGTAAGLKAPAALHHLNHIKVTRDGFRMSVLPVGAVLGSGLAHGSEVDRLNALRSGHWLKVKGRTRCSPDANATSEFTVTLKNPHDAPLAYEMSIETPRGWSVEPRLLGGRLKTGTDGDVSRVFRVRAAPFRGPRPVVRVRAVLWHPLRSGLVQPVVHRRDIAVRITTLDGSPALKRSNNKVLVLDGASALRVDLPPPGEAFTLECWARLAGPQPDQAAIVSKAESSGFGLWWSSAAQKLPYATVSFRRGGYVESPAAKAWDGTKWTHLALSCGDGRVRLFVNGRLHSYRPIPGDRRPNEQPLYIGADPNRRGHASYHFRGAIDEVRLSRGVRYKRAFGPPRMHRRDKDTLLLLHFDRTVHGIHPDHSGQDHHAWPVGRPRLAVEAR